MTEEPFHSHMMRSGNVEDVEVILKEHTFDFIIDSIKIQINFCFVFEN